MIMMMNPWRASIARRVFLAALAACALVWSAIYLQGSYQVRRAESGSFDREILTLASTIQTLAASSGDARSLRGALVALDAYMQADARINSFPGDFLSFCVWDAAAQLVSASQAATCERPSQASGFFDLQLAHAPHRVYGLQSNGYRIQVGQSVRSRQQVFDTVMFSSDGLGPLLIGFPLLLIPMWLAIRTGLRPLRRLAVELSNRSPDDLRSVTVPHVYAEIAPLVDEINGALTRFNTLLQTEREFLADAAHELRTPLALVTTQADALLHASSPAERNAAARRLSNGLSRANRLVHQLLALARLDTGVEIAEREIDVADIIRDSLASAAPQALSANMEISYDGPDALPLRAPGDAIESLVENLVSNAIRHGRQRGHVEVTLEDAAAHGITLTVRDDGPGIATQQRERLFRRFQRGEDASAAGSGLGLAIVASAARQLRASIELTEGIAGSGVAFVVRWPRAAAMTVRPA